MLADQSTTGKPNGLVVFCFTDMISAPMTNDSVAALKEGQRFGLID